MMWVPNKFLLLALVNQLLEVPASVADSDSLYVSVDNVIWRMEADTNQSWREPELVVSSDFAVVAFDIHRPWSQLFWATDFSIYRTPLYSLHSTTQIATTGRVGSLSVDWIHHHVYWTDLSEGRIEAVHTDGTARRVVYQGAKHTWIIRALALDPQIGKVFWIETLDYNSRREKVIKSSNFDGSHTKRIHADEHIYEYSPLVLDVLRKNIYYHRVNGSYSEQWEFNYGGIESKIKVFARKEPPPRSFGLAKRTFFYSNENGLFQGRWVKKETTIVNGDRVDTVDILQPYIHVLVGSMSNASQLRVASAAGEPSWRDECQNQLCQQDCVTGQFGNSTTRCLCNFGFSFDSEDQTCEEDGYVLFSTDETFGRMKSDGVSQQTILYNDSSSMIQAFDLHVISNYIYWSDYLKNTINSAPAALPTRKSAVVSNVTAFGVAVDWLYDHLYWTEDSSLMVSGLTGDHKMALLQNLDSPADIAVDPVERFIFWAECGSSPSIRRAGLDGSDVTVVVSQVTCGASLTLHLEYRALYWRDWEGDVIYCDYDGSRMNSFFGRPVRAMTLVNDLVLFVPLKYQENNSRTRISLAKNNVKLLKVMKSPRYYMVEILCENDCPGLCLPAQNQSVPPRCLCPDQNNAANICSIPNETQRTGKAQDRTGDYLELVEVTPFSITLRCAGALLTHPMLQPFLQVTEVDSLVPRGRQVTKINRTVRVSDKSVPFTIDSLNPATSYTVTVGNRVTRASFAMEVHTPPPPLAVRRLSVVTLPEEETPIPWLQQAVHFSSPNVWEDLVHKEYFLLLVSKNNYTQTEAPSVPDPILNLMQQKVKDNFMILKHYKTDEEFDDDPAMYLGNIPWAEEFWLTMVQVTEYRNQLNLDAVPSRPFYLPDPSWNTLLQDIFDQH